MKEQLTNLYNQVEDHLYWTNQTQENWDSLRPLIIQIEQCIASYEFWRDKKWYDHKVEADVYKNMYAPYFSIYCHDVRRYMSNRKIYTNFENEIKQRNWLWEYVQFVGCFIRDEIPYIDCGRYKKTVRCFVQNGIVEFWYAIEIWKEEDRQYLIDQHTKWTTCKSKYLVSWAKHVIEMLENKTIKTYEFE